MTRRISSYQLVLLLFGLLSYLMSGLGFYMAIHAGAGLSGREELTEVSGIIRLEDGFRVRRHKSYTEFTIGSDNITIRFLSKAGPHGAIASNLRATRGVVTVLVDSAKLSELRSGYRSSLIAFPIEADGGMLRSYEQISESWIRNDKIGWWLGFGFLLSGSYLVAMSLSGGRRNRARR